MFLKESNGKFQLHLSTLIVMVIVAGGLICANLKERTFETSIEPVNLHNTINFNYKSRGWPFPLNTCWYSIEGKEKESNIAGWLLDFLTGLLIVGITVFLGEYLIRWRKGKLPQP